jgi:hypothetical protein
MHLHQDSPEAEHPKSSMNKHEQMMRKHHEKMLWTTLTSIFLGAWLLMGPATLDYNSGPLAWSDAVSGILVMIFGAVALAPQLALARWMVCFVGIWLLFAPLVFWSPTSAVYLNDTLVGGLLIAFSVLVPMMPGKAHHMAMMAPGPEIPPGWTYNPSSWLQRSPAIALALISFLAARYLAAYQLGYIHESWDPFFGKSTEHVLTSKVSRMWPVSDAGLGALSYLLEALSGYMGGKTRWRTMPWMVLMFGILVIPLGVTSIVLVILQPIAVGAWCTICLFTALLMLIMIPLAVDEVVAMCQFMLCAVREGQPFWHTFWVGGTLADKRTNDQRTPPLVASLRKTGPAMVWGVGIPWNLIISIISGAYLMFVPTFFHLAAGAADSDHLLGALIITVAVIALAEVIRIARYGNVLIGLLV